MAKLEQYSRKIAYYIYDDMEPEDRAQFEAELESNEELAKEYRRQVNAVNYLKAKTQVNEYFDDPDLEEVDQLVDAYLKEKDAAGSSNEESSISDSRTRSLKRVLYPIIAAAAIFAGIIIVLKVAPGDVNDRLYSQYYSPLDDGSLVSRGDDAVLSEEFDAAIELYMAGDYAASASNFDVLAEQEPAIPEFSLFAGLSKLGEGEYAQSATMLESYLKHFDVYVPEAKWYLSLCYLKLDRIAEAKDLLSDLSTFGGKYGTDSKRMLNKLR